MNEETVSPVRHRFEEASSQYYILFKELDILNELSLFVNQGYLTTRRELFNLLNGEVRAIIEHYENKRKDNE